MITMLLLTILTVNIYSTKEITGVIYDSTTKYSIPYVSIGIEGKSVGTISNKEGRFILKTSDNLSDTDSVTFSHIGYETKKIALKEFSQAIYKVELTPSLYKIEEVVVTTVKTKQKKIGRTHSGLGMINYNFYTTKDVDLSDRLSSEAGALLKIKNPCKVNSINFFIGQNQFKHIKFRLSFYSIDNGLPKDIIIHKDIIMDIKDNYKGWYKYDLQAYDIFLEGENEIAVTLTLLEDELDANRNWFSIASAKLPGHRMFMRKKTMDKWTSNVFGLSFYLDVTSYYK